MKKTFLFALSVLLLFSFTFETVSYLKNQLDPEDPDSRYIEIPALTKKIKVVENGITAADVTFKYIPEYEYKKGLIFGTSCLIKVHDIKGVEEFEERSYYMFKAEAINKKTGEVVLSDNWQFINSGKGVEETGKAESFYLPIYLSYPMYSGDYTLKASLMNFCNKNTLTASLDISVISNDKITVETVKSPKYKEIYISQENNTVYINDKVNAAPMKMWFDGVSGFKDNDGYVNVGMELGIYDLGGKEMIHAEDVYTGKNGVIELKNGVFDASGVFTLNPETAGQSYVIKARLFDKEGDAVILGSTTISIQ